MLKLFVFLQQQIFEALSLRDVLHDPKRAGFAVVEVEIGDRNLGIERFAGPTLGTKLVARLDDEAGVDAAAAVVKPRT